MVKTQTLGVGNNQLTSQSGFTILELLIVVTIIAVATAGVAWSIRDKGEVVLVKEAERLIALLEIERAKSRYQGQLVTWYGNKDGFYFVGLEKEPPIKNWLDSKTYVTPGAKLTLGPEPIIGVQSLTLMSKTDSGSIKEIMISTDGLRGFKQNSKP